jgi:hypothetical protein
MCSPALAASLLVHGACAAGPDTVGNPQVDPQTLALFDHPTRTERKPLPRVAGNPNPRGVVRCIYFPDVTVKEVDNGEHGDDAITVTPMTESGKRPSCGEQDDPGEVVLKGGRGGYFIGAKGGFVYVMSTLGGEGVNPFTIYDALNGKMLYSDLMAAIAPEGFSIKDGVLTMSYVRGAPAECTLLGSAQDCWADFSKRARLPEEVRRMGAPVAACQRGYEARAKRGGNKFDATVWSLLSYSVTLTLDKAGKTHVLSRGQLSCDPQD